jgi:hypothetical protein
MERPGAPLDTGRHLHRWESVHRLLTLTFLNSTSRLEGAQEIAKGKPKNGSN